MGALAIGGATSASALPSAACTNSAYEYVFSTPVHNYSDMVTSSEGSGGTTLGITLTSGKTITSTIGGSITTTEGIFFASAQEQVSSSVSKSITAQTSYSYTWTVPTTWTVGYLHVGGDRYATPWKYGRVTSTCGWATSASGNSQLVYHVPASWHNKVPSGGTNLNS